MEVFKSLPSGEDIINTHQMGALNLCHFTDGCINTFNYPVFFFIENTTISRFHGSVYYVIQQILLSSNISENQEE